jgi:hypothetical protein
MPAGMFCLTNKNSIYNVIIDLSDDDDDNDNNDDDDDDNDNKNCS